MLSSPHPTDALLPMDDYYQTVALACIAVAVAVYAVRWYNNPVSTLWRCRTW